MNFVLEPISAEKEQAEIEAFGRALRVVRPYAKLISPDGREIPFPAAIYKVLEQVIPMLNSGHAVSIVPVDHMLTTQAAADLLNMSRPNLIKILDNGALPFERSDGEGSHRRIKFVDLMEYKHKMHSERKKQLAKLTQLSQESGLYDE